MKKTRILSAIMSVVLALSAVPMMAMPAAAAESAEIGTELLTDGEWTGAENVDVGYASAKGVGYNFQYFLTLNQSNKLEAGKYKLAFRARKGNEPYNRYINVYQLKNNANVEYTINDDANNKINADDTYKLTVVLRGNNGGEKLQIKVRNGQINGVTGTGDYSNNVVDVQSEETGLNTITLSTEWKTFTIDGIKFTYDKYNGNGVSHVWTILQNVTGNNICFDIAEFKLVNQKGVDCSTALAQTSVKSEATGNDGWAKNTNNVTDIFAKVLPANYDAFTFSLRNAGTRTLTNLDTGVESQSIRLTNDWQTFVTEFEIYPDSDKAAAGVNNKMCESYEGTGSNYNVWLNFAFNPTRNVANEIPAIDVDFTDFVLIYEPTGVDRLSGAVAQSSTTGNTGWQIPNGTIGGVRYSPLGFFTIKNERSTAAKGAYTYTYTGEGKAIDAGMYTLEAKLVTDEQNGTAIEAVITYLNADGEEKTEIINTNEGTKSAFVTRAWNSVSFTFSADEAITVKSVGFRKADVANTANLRFQDVSFKGVSEFSEDEIAAELVARLDTDFGATLVTPEDVGNKYMTVYNRASALDGIKVDFSKLDLTEAASYTLEFNVRSSVEFSNTSKNHDPADCLWSHRNEVTNISSIRIRPKNVAANYDMSWTDPVKFTLTGAELKAVTSIVGGGDTAFTNPFDIDNIVIKDGNGKSVWSLDFENCRAKFLADDWSITATGEAGTALLSAAKNKEVEHAITASEVFYSKNITDGMITYTGEDIELEPGIYTLKGTFRNAQYIASAAELKGHNNPENGPYTTHVASTEAIEDYNKFSLYARVDTEDDTYFSAASKKDISAGWAEYSYKFKVEEPTKLTDITFQAEHAVDGKIVDIDFKNIALYWSPIADRGDRPNPGIVMMLLLKMKEGSIVKTVKNDYIEVRNFATKGFEYTLYRDAQNPIELGTYTLTVKLRGAVGGEQIRLRVRNEDVPMLNAETGSILGTVTLTDEYTTFTATVPVTEESFQGNGKDYHVWITFFKASDSSISFDIDELSFVKDDKEFIVDDLKHKNTSHSDRYVEASGWFTTDPGCSFSTVTERLNRETGAPVGN